MKKRMLFRLLVLNAGMMMLSTVGFAGGGPGGLAKGNNDHDGNGQGPGRGSGNVPVPADPNNSHGRVNNGGNYNNGRNAQVPFDAGFSVVIATGIVIGAKRAHDKRKARRQATPGK